MGSSAWIEPARAPSPVARACLFAALVAAAGCLDAGAASTTGSFNVTVELATDNKVVAECDRTTTANAGASAVQVTCVDTGTQPLSASQASRPDPRFLLQLQRGGGTIGTVEGLVPPGTVTSWRVVSGADRDYLEIVVGW